MVEVSYPSPMTTNTTTETIHTYEATTYAGHTVIIDIYPESRGFLRVRTSMPEMGATHSALWSVGESLANYLHTLRVAPPLPLAALLIKAGVGEWTKEQRDALNAYHRAHDLPPVGRYTMVDEMDAVIASLTEGEA